MGDVDSLTVAAGCANKATLQWAYELLVHIGLNAVPFFKNANTFGDHASIQYGQSVPPSWLVCLHTVL
jgi:hypothetical protein